MSDVLWMGHPQPAGWLPGYGSYTYLHVATNGAEYLALIEGLESRLDGAWRRNACWCWAMPNP